MDHALCLLSISGFGGTFSFVLFPPTHVMFQVNFQVQSQKTGFSCRVVQIFIYLRLFFMSS